MKLTNKYNLPDTFVNALQSFPPRANGYSVTELITPPRIVILTRRHWEELEEDVSDRIWLLLGNATHYVLERGVTPEMMAEEKLKALICGTMIRGKADLWHKRKLSDYKVTSVWSAIYNPEGKPEWEAQLNIYRLLYSLNGRETDALEVVAILRDWNKGKSLQGGDYPKIPAVVIPIKMWELEQTREYITQSIVTLNQAQFLEDNELPHCTDFERWKRPSTWAVMKGKNKKAVKLCDTEKEATKYISDKNIADAWIQERKGVYTRCEEYCPVSAFCNQFKEG